MKLLLTAFDPFGGESVNPAQEAVRLVRPPVPGLEIVKLEVPTVFGRSLAVLHEALLAHRPDAVLCVGQAGGRDGLTPERLAVNLEDTAIPDNAGQQPRNKPVRKGGPDVYHSNLPVQAMADAIRAAGLPSVVSDSAGTFVCNHLMYGLMDRIALGFPGMLGGFLHVPYLPGQAARFAGKPPSLPLEDIVRGIEAAITAIAQVGRDRPE